MDFIDFQIRAWQADDTHAKVMVHSSPAGHMRKPVTVPIDMSQLGNWRWVFDQPTWYLGTRAQRLLVKLGQELANILLPRPVYVLLLSSLERMPAEDGLRLRLCLDGSLIDLPWEYLYRPDASPDSGALGGFLCLDPRISLVREPAATSLGASRSGKEQRMVFAGTLTSDGHDLWQVKQEYEELREALAPVRDLVSVGFVTAAHHQIELALRRPAAIFHYSGHTDVAHKRAYLVREVCVGQGDQTNVDPVYVRQMGAQSVHYDPLFSEALGTMLQRAKTRLAVFSACNSGRWAFVEPLIRAGVPVIVGTQGKSSVKALAAFCGRLYSSLAVGLSFDEAVTSARLHVLEVARFSGDISYEWGAVMVYMPTSDAVLIPRPRGRHVRERQEAAQRERQQTIEKVEETIGTPPSKQPAVDRTALRRAMVRRLSLEELEVLCADVQRDLSKEGMEYPLSLETVGGEMEETKVNRLIEYLDRRSVLSYLIETLRRDYKWVMDEYEEPA